MNGNDEQELRENEEQDETTIDEASDRDNEEMKTSSDNLSVKIIEADVFIYLLSSLQLTLDLWCEKSDISRQDYVRLRQVFLLFDAIMKLSAKLNTLKRQVKLRISMLWMIRKAISILIRKQSSFAMRDKQLSIIRRIS